MDKMKIGERIKQRRNELGITQTQIQEMTSISSGNLSGIEHGRNFPSATALYELSQILNCSVDWILTGKSSICEKSSPFDIKDDDEAHLLSAFRCLSDRDRAELLGILDLKIRIAAEGADRKVASSLSEPDVSDELVG